MKKLIFLLLVSCGAFAAINDYHHVKTDGTGTISDNATTWLNAWNEDTLKLYLENSVSAGDVFYVLEGAYVFGAAIDFNLRDGTATSPIAFIGVKSTTTDTAASVPYSAWASDTANCPDWSLGDYQFKTSDYCIFKNIKFRGASPSTGNYVAYAGLNNVFQNCVFNCNYESSASRFGLYAGAYNVLIDCVFLSANCKGVSLASSSIRVFNCVFNGFSDATNGIAITVNGHGGIVAGNKFNGCKTAINLVSFDYTTAYANTYYNCGTDVSATDAYAFVAVNELHDSTKTDSYVWTTQTDCNFFWDNHAGRCADYVDGVDSTTVFADFALTTGDPKFANPPDSLQLDSDSPCLNTGTGPR